MAAPAPLFHTLLRPKTLSEYKSTYGDGKYVELGRLGPDTDSEELLAKRDARNRMQAYGAALTAENAALLQKGDRGGKCSKGSGSKASRRSEDPAAAAAAAKEKEHQEQAEGLHRAQEYAKQVAERNRRQLRGDDLHTEGGSQGRSPQVARRRVVSPIRTGTVLTSAGASVAKSHRRSSGGNAQNGTSAAHNNELQRLLAEHDRLAAEVQSFRGQIPRST